MIGGVWRREPFRVFFPLGVALAWLGVGHWVAYWAGWIAEYSCAAHGLVQIHGFLLAFALGFLLTAIPRRTESAPPSGAAIAAAALALAVGSVAALGEQFRVAEALAAAVVLGVVAFAVRRFVGAGGARRPPAAFVLIPLGLACSVGGGALVGWGGPQAIVLGRLLVEQGLFFCLVMGAGALVLPLMGGAQPPSDMGSSPAVTRAALGYGLAGLAVVASLAAEAAGSARVAPVVRGLVVAATLARGAGLGAALDRPGWNRRVARLAAWLVPLGPIAAGLAPDYRVPALHVTFIGGFALLAFAVATHVTAAHLELPRLRDGRPPVVAALALALLLATATRVAADATGSYFEHLAVAGALWILGTGLWVARLLPAWLRKP
jgi:uncharacterized protein involved in response to NO